MSLEELLYTTGQEKMEIGIQKGRQEAKIEERSKFEDLLRKKGINEKTIEELLESLRNEDNSQSGLVNNN